jgi:hypothetical protein
MAEEETSAWSAGEYPVAPGEAVAHDSARAGGDEVGIRGLAAELLTAIRDAGTAMFEAHKQLAAEQTAELADAVQRFGRSVDQTQSRVIDHYCERGATWISEAAQTMRTRSWGEIASDLEAFARRRPAWFMLAALGTGFAAGRLLTAAAERERRLARAVQPISATPPPVAGQSAPPRTEEVL